MRLADLPDNFGNKGPLASAQRFRDPEIVQEKLAARDFTVALVPVRGYRVVVDGHHALSAALKAKAKPRFVLSIERALGEDESASAWLRDQRRRGGDAWHDPVTGRKVAIASRKAVRR